MIHAPRRPEIGLRELLFLLAALLPLPVLLLRLWYLQVVIADELTRKAQSMQWSTVSKVPPRGLIFDRKGKLLAGVKAEIVVTARPASLKEHPDVVGRVANILGVDVSKLQERVDASAFRPHLPVTIYVGASIEQATVIAETSSELPGIGVESQPMRDYPDTTNFTHVLGYVWTPSQADLKRLAAQKVKPGEYVGKVALESAFERELMGKPGVERVEVDARRRPLRVLGRDAPVPGEKLILSIDSELQKLANELLMGASNAGAAAVALDPRTGEILCVASVPSYDAEPFLTGIRPDAYRRLVDDPLKPLFNRAIRGSYSPGSTFKIVTTLAAAKSGLFDPIRTVHCPGYYSVGTRKVKCLGVHGTISFERAMIHSCNTYFSDLAVRVGGDRLRQAAVDAGLGKKTGIDLGGEGRGVVPTDEWLRAVLKLPAHEKPKWYPGDTVNLGIGQGEISATPLQMACVAAMVANEGTIYRPHVVSRVVATKAERAVAPETAVRFDLPQATGGTSASEGSGTWPLLKRALVGVVESGTAKRAAIPGIRWAGKTGSTEHNRGARTHSWFVGYAPADDPKIAIAVVVEQSGHGGEVSAPIASKIVAAYLHGFGGAKASPTASNPPVSSPSASRAQASPARSPSAR